CLLLADGKRAVHIGDSRVELWDIRTLPPAAAPVKQFSSWCLGGAYAPAGRRFFVGHHDGTVQAWDETDAGVARAPPSGPENPFVFLPADVRLSPDGRWLAAGVRSRETT